MRALSCALLCAAGWLPLSATGDYVVRAFIQPDQDITDQQTVRLVIEASGQGGPQMSVTGLERLSNLTIASGPERAFNSTWSGGRMSAKTQLRYSLLPTAPGKALIPTLRVTVGGELYTTRPIEFEVRAAPAGPGRPRASGGGGSDQADVFLESRTEGGDVWVGQAVPLSVLLYTAEEIAQPSIVSAPALSSFWVEDLDVDINAESSSATLDGRRYAVYPMVRKVLVPQTPGEVEIEPFAMQIPVQVRARDPFERLFGRMQTVVRKTKPLTLRVRALPEAGRPADFSGAVGDLEFEVKLDSRRTQVGDAVTLTATVEGEGFLRAVAAPELDVPPDIKVYDPKVQSSTHAVRGRLISRKSWEWVLVPLVAGELEIPDLRFSYFDPAKSSYRTRSSGRSTLSVQEGGELPEQGASRREIMVQRRDLAFIKPLRGSLKQKAQRAHESDWFLLASIAPLLWAPAWIWLGRRRARLQSNRGLARSRRARKRAQQRLKSARRHLEGESAPFHEELARALVEYVADRFDRSAAGMTYELADDLLSARGLDPELRRRFRSCLESCDFARYVPATAATERREQLLEEATGLIDALERAL